MSETKHTPTPWQVKHPDHEPWYVIGNIDGPDYGRGYYETICDCDLDSRSSMDLEVAKANAAYIVEAVNNHERLTQRVQELEKALRFIRDFIEEAGETVALIEAALTGTEERP